MSSLSSNSHLPWNCGAIAFDLDGVLIDTEPIFRETMRRFLDRRGIPFDEQFMRTMMGMPAAQSLPRLRDHFGLSDPAPVISDECKRHFLEILGNELAPLMPGVIEMLDWIAARRVPCAIATSSSRQFVQHVFGPHGLLDRFRFVLTSDDVSLGKPHPEIYETAATRLGVAADRLLVIEDSPAGLRAAKAAGARCVVVPHQHTPLAALQGVDAIVPRLWSAEMRALFGSNSGGGRSDRDA